MGNFKYLLRVLGRSPRRRGCGEDSLMAEPRGKAFPLILLIPERMNRCRNPTAAVDKVGTAKFTYWHYRATA